MRAVLMLVLMAGTVEAQTVVGRATLPPELWELGVQVSVVEADGDPSTVELLAVRPDGKQSVNRANCQGRWLDPRVEAGAFFLSTVTVQRVNGRDFWFIKDAQGLAVLMAMEPCTP